MIVTHFSYLLSPSTEEESLVHACKDNDYYMLCGLFRYKPIWIATNEEVSCAECRQMLKKPPVLPKVRRVGGLSKLRPVRVSPEAISEGVVKLERVRGHCPACGQQVEAVARDGQVKGYCAAAKQYVDFQIKTQGRDSRGHFIKGNVPLTKKGQKV